MTEAEGASAPKGATAGAMLRAARERQGIHIAVLAAAIKVSPRKLDALEGDRYQELPDAAFTRALAQTVCRALKTDPGPVLALLPVVKPAASLESVSEGLNMPFRDRSGGSSSLAALLPRAPLLWAALALLAAAALVVYWPARLPVGEPAPQAEPVLLPAQPAGEAPAAGAPVADSLAAPPQGAAPASAAGSASAAAPAASSALQPTALAVAPAATGASISVTEPVWLEVIDGSGEVVFQRTIQPGENLSFDQPPPLKLKVGNVAGARLSYRGEPVDLAPFTRSNVARIELK